MAVLLVAPGAQAAPLTAPSPPQNVTASPVTGGVQVDWDPPAFDGGGPSMLTYRVYRGTTLLATDLSATDFLDTSIGTSAAASEYTVTAVNEVGESAHGGSGCLGWPDLIIPGNCVALVISIVTWVIGSIPP